MMRRFLFRNQRHLFRRRDDASGKDIFSGLPPQAPVKVYEHDYWWSDSWDPMQYGRDYDFSRPFFEQFKDLLYTVPLFSKSAVNMINSDYSDQSGWLKNAYLCFDTGYIENSSYLVSSLHIKESLDLYQCEKGELCYENVMVDDGYRVFFSRDCDSSSDIWFSQDLGGCTYCFGCSNLRNKSYHIFNEPYSKDIYFEKLKEFNLGSYSSLISWREKATSLWQKFPMKYMHGTQNTNVSGEHIQNSKNIGRSYFIHDGQDIKYSQIIFEHNTDSYDWTNFGVDASQIYESVTCGFEGFGLKFCWECWRDVRDLEYCAFSSASSNLFGCVGLRKKQYCIFNKQYSKEEYSTLREKIIEQMNSMPYVDKKGRKYGYGEFFPEEISPLCYNETMAQDFFPLDKETVKRMGYDWRDPDPKEFQITKRAEDLPDHINEVPDDTLKEIIGCASCKKAYRIIATDLEFYRKLGLPLPRLCINCRFAERMKLANPPKFWHRSCQCGGAADQHQIYQNQAQHFHGLNQCPNEFETSYAPERKEIIYCETCYQAEIV